MRGAFSGSIPGRFLSALCIALKFDIQGMAFFWATDTIQCSMSGRLRKAATPQIGFFATRSYFIYSRCLFDLFQHPFKPLFRNRDSGLQLLSKERDFIFFQQPEK